jgi:FKBP-type peptidyl-prolyl cis-trans isomerase FkpA
MKNISYLFLIVSLVVSSCSKDTSDPISDSISATGSATVPTTPGQSIIDNDIIKAYLLNNKLAATKDSSGLYYQVLNSGSGVATNPTSTITVTYTGTLLDGTILTMQSTPVSGQFSGLIPGWQIGLQHIRVGGSIILYIPSGLAYGASSPSVSIPPNSIFIYTINLLNVQ